MSDILEGLDTTDRARLRPHVRPAFIPRVEDGEASGPVTKVGGRPWLPAGTTWPTCPNCNQAMALILQLDLESLPAGAPDHGKGLAQLFYCTNTEPHCEVVCEAFFPFARSVVARVVDKHAPGADADARVVPNAPAPRRIVGWEEVADLPRIDELGELGMEVGEDDTLEQELEARELPRMGDKLGGWPHWIQGIEYPECPDCQGAMGLVFQMGGGDAIAYEWGSGGAGHLTQCAAHPERLAFGWAC